jgi:hypothetical protein
VSQKTAHGWLTASGALSLAAGIAVLAMLVWQIGTAQILDGLLKVRWAFPLIVVLGGLRFVVRAWAWSLCIEPPHRLRLTNAFAAVLAGDALGNATPLGPVVGEPAKVAFARPHVAAGPSLTALAIENLVYSLATAAMIVAGTLALLFSFDLPATIRNYSELAVIGIALTIALALIVLRARPALVSRWLPLVAGPGTRLHSRRDKLQALERDIYSFRHRRRGTLLPVTLLEVTFHALGVAETHLAMWMILGGPPPILTSFVLETASRLITVLFKFIPMQIGVAEGGLALVTELLGFGTATGLTFSLVRKARVAVWAVIGAGLLIRRGITPRMVLSDQNLQIETRKR